MAGERLEDDRFALTLLGPRPPKAEGDEGYDDEDEGPEDNYNYEVGEVTRPMHDSSGDLYFAIRDFRWNGPEVMKASWGAQRKDALNVPSSPLYL